MESGHLALVRYEGQVPALYHARLLLAPTTGTNWMILTPDFDRYEEQLDHTNSDFDDFVYLGSHGNPPPHIPGHLIYSFAPMDPGVLAHQMTQARVEANAIRVIHGLPPLAPPQPVAAIGAAVPLPPPPVPAAGVLGVAPAAPVAAALPPAAAPAAGFSWVVTESSGGRARGDVICVEPNPLPPGSLTLGDRALLPGVNGVREGCFALRVPNAEAPNYKLEDLRILPIHFDGQGVRRRDFSGAVSCMVNGVPQGGGLQLEGPVSALNLMKNLRDQNLTPTTFHEFWLRSAEIPKGDRSVYEHECLSRILEGMITVDQLNICALQSAELMCRRMQVIREAHRVSPSNPDYSSADHFMGWKWRRGAHEVDSTLAAHVATELRNEAQILKEARKAREEQQNRRRNPGGKPKDQGGGGDGK